MIFIMSNKEAGYKAVVQHSFLKTCAWLCWVLVVACGIWFPDQGSNLGPLHGEWGGLNHWTTRECKVLNIKWYIYTILCVCVCVCTPIHRKKDWKERYSAYLQWLSLPSENIVNFSLDFLCLPNFIQWTCTFIVIKMLIFNLKFKIPILCHEIL